MNYSDIVIKNKVKKIVYENKSHLFSIYFKLRVKILNLIEKISK